jgi:hypothetical protein
MIPMLLVVGSLVPASDSPELTAAPSQRSAVGATVDVRDLIRRGMTTNEVRQILAVYPEPRVNAFLVGVIVERLTYEKAGIEVCGFDGIISEVTRFKPTR